MNFCKQCGHQVEKEETFCRQCGAPLDTADESPELPAHQDQVEEPARRPMTRKTKRNLVIAAAIILIVIIGYQTAAHLNRPEKVADAFIEALNNDDAHAAAAILKKGNPEIEVSEDSAAKLISYYDDHRDLQDELAESLRAEAAALDHEEQPDTDEDTLIHLKKDGKKWLVLDRYVIAAKPVYIKASANEKQTKLTAAGKDEKTVSDTDKAYIFGPFLPYEVEVKAERKTDYATIQDHTVLDPAEDLDGKYMTAELDVAGDYVYIDTDDEDAMILVNGKNTGKRVRDIDRFGPIQTDGKMKIQLQHKGAKGIEKTDPVTINAAQADSTIELYFGSDDTYAYDEPMDDLSEEAQVEDVVYSYYSAVASKDFAEAGRLQSASRSKTHPIKPEGYANTYDNTVTHLEVQDITDSKALVYVELSTTDETDDGSLESKYYTGTWQLIKENGEWKLNDSKMSEE